MGERTPPGGAIPLPAEARPVRRERRRALAVLAICAAVLAAGAAVEVSAERAHLHGVEGPPCLVRGVLGDGACPGCGLTRSTALVLQGRFGDAAGLHAGGFVVAFLCAAGIPFTIDVLRRGERPAHRVLGRLARLALLLGLVGPWLWLALADRI